MKVEPGPVARALLGMAGEGTDVHELARDICWAFVEGTDVNGAAISSLTLNAHRQTLFATDPAAAALEDLQFTLGEGACIEAATSGRPALMSDLIDSTFTSRWPVFATAVAEQTGVRALFALPLQLGTINIGVIDLYRITPGPLPGSELRDVLAATDTAMLMLLGAQIDADVAEFDHPERLRKRSDQGRGGGVVRGGLSDDRAEVHQATGIVLAQLDILAQDAFVRLRAYAFAHHRPLAEVASDVVTRRLVFTQDMD